MTHTPADTTPARFPLEGAEEEKRAKIRDRLLLFARGMDAEPLLSMEIATESMRRAQARSAAHNVPLSPQAAMAELHGLLREKGITPQLANAEGQRLRSTPPMNRRPMVAEEMDRSLLRLLARKIGLSPAREKTGHIEEARFKQERAEHDPSGPPQALS